LTRLESLRSGRAPRTAHPPEGNEREGVRVPERMTRTAYRKASRRPTLDCDPSERRVSPWCAGRHTFLPGDWGTYSLIGDDGGPPALRPFTEIDASRIGMELLVGVDLMTDVALEPLSVGFPIEGALTWKGIPEPHDPRRATSLGHSLVDAHAGERSDEGHAAAITGPPEGVEVTESSTIWS